MILLDLFPLFDSIVTVYNPKANFDTSTSSFLAVSIN